MKNLIALCCVVCVGISSKSTFAAQDFRITHPQNGVTQIADDAGNWGGMSSGTSHQNEANYQTEKIIDIPAGELANAKYARLRVFMALQDYSYANPAIKPNGLDESFELVVNGKAYLYPDDDPSFSSRTNGRDPLTWAWHDFIIPVSELKNGANTFLFRKTPSEKNDDFLYIGIDNSVSNGHSSLSLDGGKTWTTKQLNTIKATGEYMARLLLLSDLPESTFDWKTGQRAGDTGIIGYAGKEENALRLELDSTKYDSGQPLKVLLSTPSALNVKAANDVGKAVTVKSTFNNNTQTLTIAPQYHAVTLITIPLDKISVSNVQLQYQKPIGEIANQIQTAVNMAPPVSAPIGKAVARKPQIKITETGFTVENVSMVAAFQTKPALRLLSLRNEYLAKNILAHPQSTHLFLIEKDGKKYGAENWNVQQVQVLSPQKLQINLLLKGQQLSAQWTISISDDGMSFGLNITNTAPKTQTWKTAFPQIGGLQLSQNAGNDYYLFPYYEGLIANNNTSLRTYYGGDSAWWQMVDLFSPKDGAGISMRCLDTTGLYKGIDFQKGTKNIDRPNVEPQISGDLMDPAMGWENTLPAADGSAMAIEYLAYTRESRKSYIAPDAEISMHEGGWQTPMKTYADWAHRVWQWRPSPSKLDDVWQISSLGWRTDSNTQPAMIDKTGWRADRFKGQVQAAELMGWWQWSDKGPWKVPLDQIEQKLGKAFYNRYKYAFTAVDPVTGKVGYMFNRGDYDYHQSWGGEAGMQKYVQLLHQNGQLATLYTDPLLVDDNTELAKQALKYAVKNPYWKDIYKVPLDPPGYVAAYGSWSFCVDTQWYQKFVVDQMTRIVHDTNVDGIRLDEFGIAHRPGADFNEDHPHIFAEPGHNQTLQAESLMCKNVHAAINKIHPGFVLTAEFTGYDHLAANLDGALNYSIFSQNDDALRPVPLSVFHFYFPEHKMYVLDTSSNPQSKKFAFWNAMGAFELFYPAAYAHVLEENGDAFSNKNSTPLIPTLLPRVYANQFRTADKSITLIYNARKFTVDEPLLKVLSDARHHYFDLLNNRELPVDNNAISLLMHSGDVAAVARLSKVLLLQNNTVSISKIPANATLIICDKDGNTLWRQKVSNRQIALPASLPPGAVAIKLFSGKYLVDAIALNS